LLACSYKILQSSDYDDTRLITGENLRRHRSTKLAHLSLKHLTLLGVVRSKITKKKRPKKKAQKKNATSSGAHHFLFDEAVAAAENYDSEDDDDEDEDEDDDENEIEIEDEEEEEKEEEEEERGLSASEESDSSLDSQEDADDDDEEEEEEGNAGGDLNEQAVQRAEAEIYHDESSSMSAKSCFSSTDGDHNYACPPHHEPRADRIIPRGTANWRKKKARYKYSFLYAMVVSGAGKQIKNCIPRGVAVLSNSKTIILSHVNAMLQCLDPGMAEICYMDTDSCVFSLTHEKLEDNLLVEKLETWKNLDIIADESGEKSCHGKMKLEGTFKVGLFKALKIYRLFSTSEFEKEKRDKSCYTRCKGVNRYIATLIPNKVFDRDNLDQVVVHRSCLRPTRTGEMLIAHECKSLAAPFNLKRYVTHDGLHTFPISYFVADDHPMHEEEDGDANRPL